MPPETLGLKPSFGFGDRTGLATPGHVRAMQQAGAGIAPIFPQQSIREMVRTHRSAPQVMSDATAGLREAGWTEAFGADADHLKTPADVDVTANAGFVFFTIDPSDHVDRHADNYAEAELRTRIGQLDPAAKSWAEDYEGRRVKLPGDVIIDFDNEICQRAAVKYGPAIVQAVELARHIRQTQEAAGRDFEIELSVDETDQPTTLAEHFIIADQCLRQGMRLVSLAPRFIGDFEKGVDFKGSVDQLTRSLTEHAAVAKALGPYKLSLHSGSDKLSMYPALARATGGLFHVKTAGTSYLEALRVVLRHDPFLFRQIVAFAREKYPTDRATYHVSASVDDVPDPRQLSDDQELEENYLGDWATTPAGMGFTQPGRQILHCTFGSVLTDPRLGPTVLQLLREHRPTYDDVLCLHFAKHLEALQQGF